ncbi:putative pentatricopeptide repeat-containing protein At1g13630 [Zingiber officinale]|uniref:putative pentatricopeptide repeat-containing protein At1g13630 n=1 Tax=Zingiber officinale TaxID=94328 RepID=UPI001C4BC438|nr:putative pentatricopeptide repeat-containing protein At1g13630 [Zingiber officinale]
MVTIDMQASVSTYHSLLNTTRYADIALDLYREIKASGIYCGEHTIDLLIHGLCKQRRVRDAISFSQELSQGKSFYPCLITFNSLISRACNSGFFMIACVLFNALCKRGWIAKVEELLDEIKDNNLDMDLDRPCTSVMPDYALNVMPNSFFHGTILSSMCKKGLMSEAKCYLEFLVANDQALNITLYNIVIDGFAKVGDVEEALGLYEQLIRSAVTPTVVTYNSLIYGFCKIGNPTDAKEFLKQIDMHGLASTTTTYNTHGFCEIGDINSMRMMLEEMDGRAIMPNIITYSVVIKPLCKSGQVKEAFDKLNNRVALGIVADSMTYTIVMQVDRAEEVLYYLLHQGIRLRKFYYMTVVQAYCVMAMPDKAFVLFDEMLKSGYEITIKDLSAVINRLCKR